MMGDEQYFQPLRIIDRLQQFLQERADGSHKEWTANYYKVSETIVRGVKMQEIRFKVHQWQRQWETEQQTVPAELERDVAGLLLQQPWIEDQLAAVIFVSENLIQHRKITSLQVFQLYEPTFAEAYISNRLVCDNFASKVLVPLLNTDPGFVASRLCEFWLPAPNLWQARSALAALSAYAADAVHQEALLYGVSVLIRRPEEEAKSVAGTALRALCKHREDPVDEFLGIEENLFHFDAVSLDKATKNIRDPRRIKRLKDTRKRLQKVGLDPNTPSAALPPPGFVINPVAGPSAAASSIVEAEAGAPGYDLSMETAPAGAMEVGIGVPDVGFVEHAEQQQLQVQGVEELGGEAEDIEEHGAEIEEMDVEEEGDDEEEVTHGGEEEAAGEIPSGSQVGDDGGGSGS